MSDLQTWIDRQDIVELVDRLFVAVDERDWATARSYFADRVRFDMTSAGEAAPRELTPVEITDAWEGGLAPIQAIHHQSGNFRVRVSGDVAECSCYGTAFHYRPVRSGRNTRTFVGSYDFRLARTSDAWRITEFRFNLKFVTGNLALEKDEPT